MNSKGEALLLNNLAIFDMASDLSRHAARQQAVAAKNLANIDTPEFTAKTLLAPEFGSTQSAGATQLRQTRAQHMPGIGLTAGSNIVEDKAAEKKPNGNSVSLEAETLKSIEAERLHSRAMAIYRSSLTILRSSIGRGR